MQKLAIVGLGRVGSGFLQTLLQSGRGGFEIVAVAELHPTPGLEAAKAAGIPALSLADLIARSPEVDIVFDLSGQAEVRQALRHGLADLGNGRTVIASESIAQLISTLLTDGDLPPVHATTGY